MNRSISNLLRLAVVLSTVVAFAGCSTSEYEKRYEKKIEELWRLEPFLELQTESTAIPLAEPAKGGDAKNAVAARLRIPNIFDNNAKRYDKDKEGEEPIDVERKFPPFVRSLPDFRFSYERFLGAAGKQQQPVYFYACATQGRNPKYEDFLNKAIGKTKGLKVSEVEEQWESVKCEVPERDAKGKIKPIEWNRLSITLPKQRFVLRLHKETDEKELDGVVEAFVRSKGDRHVMFILRMPTDLEAEIDLDQLTKSIAGTLSWSDGQKGEE